MHTRIYAGIGSRRTPPHILRIMHDLAHRLSTDGWTLASGGAAGADHAFADGAGEANRLIYIPWPGFNGLYPTPGNSFATVILADAPSLRTHAQHHHPAWHRCSPGARKLHGRNAAILLGQTLDRPVDFVICWTPGGLPQGGTGLGIRIAVAHSIPVYNLASNTGDDVLRIIQDRHL